MAEKEKKAKTPAKAKSDSATKTSKAKDERSLKVAKKPAAEAEKKPKTKAAKPEEVTQTASLPDAPRLQAVPARTKAITEETVPATSPAPTRDQIAQLAHRLWKERGGHHGGHDQDWFRAERELRGMAS